MDPRSLARTFRDFTRAPFTQVPQAARGAWLRALEQLRLTLDLPSRRELSELTARLEALDARIVSLAADRLLATAGATATLPAATPAPAVEAAAVAREPDAPAATTAGEPSAEAIVAALAADAAADADDDAADPALDGAAEAGDATVVGTNGHRRNRKQRKNTRR